MVESNSKSICQWMTKIINTPKLARKNASLFTLGWINVCMVHHAWAYLSTFLMTISWSKKHKIQMEHAESTVFIEIPDFPHNILLFVDI